MGVQEVVDGVGECQYALIVSPVSQGRRTPHRHCLAE